MQDFSRGFMYFGAELVATTAGVPVETVLAIKRGKKPVTACVLKAIESLRRAPPSMAMPWANDEA